MFVSEEEIKLLSIFVGPTIVATIISGIFSIFLSRKTAGNEYITQERANWRKSIREICEKINPDINKLEELKNALKLLKLYLNAYGLPYGTSEKTLLKAGQILKDTHIWMLIISLERNIEQYESQLNNDKEVKNKKKSQNNPENKRASFFDDTKKACSLLITYLSLLLKYDWERSKEEVRKNISVILGLAIMAINLLGMYIIPIIGNGDNLTISNILLFIGLIFLTFLWIYTLDTVLVRKSRKEMTKFGENAKDFTQIEKTRKDSSLVYHSFSYFIILVDLVISLTLNIVFLLQFNTIYEFNGLLYELVICFYMIGLVLYSMGRKQSIRNDYNYVVEVKKLMNEFYGE